MIAFIKGTAADASDGCLIIENNGIGYRILVPARLSDRVRRGDDVMVYTHLGVREDALTLYGFATRDDLSLFRLLLGVSGIGPKGALSVLSVMSAEDLRFAVLAEDLRTLSKIPGIGRKTAQKLVLELKDKIDIRDAAVIDDSSAASTAVQTADDAAQSEAVLALTALGYLSAEAYKAVRTAAALKPDAAVEDLLKTALKQL